MRWIRTSATIPLNGLLSFTKVFSGSCFLFLSLHYGLYEFTVVPAWCAQVAPSTAIFDTDIRLDIRQLEIPTHYLDSSLTHHFFERTRTDLISSLRGYDQPNSHKVTNHDLLSSSTLLNSTRQLETRLRLAPCPTTIASLLVTCLVSLDQSHSSESLQDV